MDVAFLAANAKRAGFVTLQVNDPISGRFDMIIFIAVLFGQGFTLFVTKQSRR